MLVNRRTHGKIIHADELRIYSLFFERRNSADAFNFDTFGNKSTQAHKLSVFNVVAVYGRRTDGDIDMTAGQCVYGVLSAVIRNRFGRDAEFFEQYGNHRVTVVAGTAGCRIFNGFAGFF